MFRKPMMQSIMAVCRVTVKPMSTMRSMPLCVNFTSNTVKFCHQNTNLFEVQRRQFSETFSTVSNLKQRIEACGINDAGKEKIISEEAKKKNFEALRTLGEEFIVNKDTKEFGILCFVQAADNGDFLSQFAVGNFYMQRYWQEKMKPDFDPRTRDSLMEKAMIWYDMSAKQGHIPSKVGYAKMCLEDPTTDNVQKALRIYEEADHCDNMDATYNLGFIHYEGLYNVPSDRLKGYQYLHRAADFGDVSACYFIGYSYHRGLYEHDNPNNMVPTISEPGKGGMQLCVKNVSKAMEYLEKAAKGGHSKAQIYLHQMMKDGDDVEKNVNKARDYLIQAMRQGDPEALFIRGNQLYTGEDGEQEDKERALKIFLEAGERGNADAMLSAGAMIYNGEGHEKDLKKAFEVYTNAASLGSLPAIKNIASMYLVGEGVEKDIDTAKNLMKFIEEEEKKLNGSSQ